MDRVWIVSPELFDKRDDLSAFRQAEVTCVRDFEHLKKSVNTQERPVVLASLADLEKIRSEPWNTLSVQLLPKNSSGERLNFFIRLALKQAKLQHDLEAAESIAWSGTGFGQYDDPSIEHLGGSIMQLAAARDMQTVEQALADACKRICEIEELCVVAYPETAGSQFIGKYQLAVPIQFQGQLRAHVYVRFSKGEVQDQKILDQLTEILLNMSDGVSLAVERNLMLAKAEETKTVWEASFDAVEDPVAILDDNYIVLRGNRAFGKLSGIPLVKLAGREPGIVSIAELASFPREVSSEWSLEKEGKHYRTFLDPIRHPLGSGRFVLRFHDVTEERTLTEKILAKEQVAELGVLVGSVAHEINNPIAGILAIGQLMQKELTNDAPLRMDVDNIVEAAERCRRIVQTMLSLVRKSDEERRSFDLQECLASALELLGSEAKRLQVRVKLPSVSERNTMVFADRNRLMQVFFHLLQHSLMAIAEKKTKVNSFDAFLRLEVIEGFGNAEVRFEDNGDTVKHEYEAQSSVAFAVTKMILEEHEAQYFFIKSDGLNVQRIILPLRTV